MNAYAEHARKYKDQTGAEAVSPTKHEGPAFQFVDHRSLGTKYRDRRDPVRARTRALTPRSPNVLTTQLSSFTNTLPQEDNDLAPPAPGTARGLNGTMKIVHAIKGNSGTTYVTAKGQSSSPEKRLANEAGYLATLRAAGLHVPKVYKKLETPDDDESGVLRDGNGTAFIIMEYIDGQFADLAKGGPALKDSIREYFTRVPQKDHASRAATIMRDLQAIQGYLEKNIIIDLQLILEEHTGRVVIIDPARAGPDALAPDDETTTKSTLNADADVKAGYWEILAEAEKKLLGFISPSHKPDATPRTKEELVELYEECHLNDEEFTRRLTEHLAEGEGLTGEKLKSELAYLIELSQCI